MGIVERRQRQKEEVRNSILHASWQLVTEEGWQALSIRKIADAIEYSVPVIYSHFENKEAILLEFTKEGFRLLAQAVERAKESESTPSGQLMAMARAYWQFAFEHKEYYQVMFGLGIPACDLVNQVSAMKQFSDVIIGVIQKAIAAGPQPDTNYFLKFHTYWSILHGLVSIRMIETNVKDDALSQMILQDAVSGFIKALEG